MKKSREKLDPDTKAPIMDKDGNPVMEEVEVKIPQFRVVSVFDVSQTYGKPLPTLAKDLQGDVPRFEAFMDAVIRSAPVPVRTAPLQNGPDGYFNLDKQEIVIREDMSQIQTVSALIHEITHSKLHNRYPEEYDPLDPLAEKPKDRRTGEPKKSKPKAFPMLSVSTTALRLPITASAISQSGVVTRNSLN